MALQIRRGSDVDRQSIIPKAGEPIFTTDTKKLYIGDGSTAGGIIVDTTTGLSNVVDDATPQLGGNLDLNNNDIVGTGNINITGSLTANGAFDLKGSIFADDSTLLVDGISGTIPASVLRGTATVDVTGNLTGNVSGTVTGDLLGSVFADDSTAMVDAQNKTFTGNLTGSVTGDLNGSVFADDSTLIIDSVANRVDINGGTIDATPIGGNAPAPGAFTTISTTGAATLSSITNTATLNIDATTGIRINETSSTHQRIDLFSAAATGFGTGFLALNNNHSNQYTNDLLFTRTRGTPASPTAAQVNDKIGGMTAQVWDGSAYQAGALVGFTTKSISSGNVGANFTISTRNGAIGTLTTKFEVAETGTVKMDTIESLTADTDLNISANGTGAVNISDVIVKLPNLPTSDPSVAGQLWRSGNDVKISTG